MKKILLSTLASAMLLVSQAQLAPNSVCPNFTGTDLDGNSWDLYELLDSGKSVIIEVSAAWCNPCWGYHSSNALKNFYNQYGPEGTNESMVLFIEGEATNTSEQLYAAANTNQYPTHSMGDWVTGTPFPIIDDASIANLLEITAFPTVYLVCPDRIINEIGQVTTAQAYAAVSNVNCSAASDAIDPRFVSVSSMNASCSTPTAGLNIKLQNKGTEVLTSATITVTGADAPVVYDWTGELATYEIADVVISGIITDGPTDVTVTVTSTDDNTENSTSELSVNSEIIESTTHIRVTFMNDPWPGENSWKIKNSTGTVVASSPTFAATQTTQTTTTYDYWVPATGCYTFEFADAYGDGLNGTYWGGPPNYFDGSITAHVVDENGNNGALLYGNNGSAPMANPPANSLVTAMAPFEATSVVSTNDLDITTATEFGVFPNPASGIVTLNYSLNRDSEVLVDVINSVGVRVMSERLGSQKHGNYNTALDLSALAAGVYMVSLNTDGAISTVRVVVQ